MIKRKIFGMLLALCTGFGLAAPAPSEGAEAREKTVLVTTFPIYQIVRNITHGRDGIRVDLMLPSQMGCPHDYALTPQDMQKLAKADILVVNGLGMEEFLGAPVKKANPKIRVIDSSNGIEGTLKFSERQNHGHAETGHHPAVHHRCEANDDHGHHHHGGINPHLFASPRMSAQLVMNIASQLSKSDPKGASIYFHNAQVYAETMNRLADDMAAMGGRLANNRIVQPHGAFDYLAYDMGLEIVAVMQAHGQDPSASEMAQLVRTIKDKRAGVIFTEPQYAQRIGKSLSKETGVPVATLDPVASGPENAPLNYYETVMRQNMKTIESTLGVK